MTAPAQPIRPPYSLSTCWNFARHDSMAALVEEVTALGFTHVELSSSLSAEQVEELATLVEAGAVRVSSLHNPVPRPAEVLRGDVQEPWLSAMDPQERAFAVRLVRDSLDQALRLGAGVVVVHVGRLQSPAWDASFKLLLQLHEALGEGQRPTDPGPAAIIHEMRRLRAEAVPAQYPGLLEAMEQVAEHAAQTGVRIGIETRLHYPEIPCGDEYQMILDRFGEAGIYYWHDSGHAQEQEIEGFGSHRELIERYGPRAAGAHLHDVIYPWPDHQPPGRGLVDFEMIAQHLHPQALRVLEILELVEPVTGEHIVAGVRRLEQAFSA